MRTDELKQFYSRYKVIIWPVLIGVVSLAVLGVVVVPQIMNYFSTEKQVDAEKARLAALDQKLTQLQQLDENSYRQNLQLALAALPADKEVPQSLTLLQSAINQSNMTIEGMKFVTNGSDTNSRGSFQISVTVSGQLPSLKRLLDLLQKSPRLFRLETIDTQSIKGNTIVESDLLLELYYEPLNTKLGAIDQPLPTIDQKSQQLLNDLYARSQSAVATSSSSFIPLGKSNPFE